MASEHSGQGRQNRLLVALTPEDHSLLAPHLKEQALKVGSLLREAGEPVHQIYFPHQGMVSLLAIMSDGQGIETATVGSVWFRRKPGFYEGGRPGSPGGFAHFQPAISGGPSEK